METAILVFELVVLLAIVLGLISQSVRIVREYQRLVIFRLGKCIGARGPGPVWLIPLVDRPVLVDQRELFLEVPHQSCITKDNVPIRVDFLIYRQIMDAVSSVVAVQNFAGASQGIAATTLRAVIGDIALDDVLAQRERINTILREKLDEVTERWGVKVTAVEIREIVPPNDVQEAMNRQMSAERTRRAFVTEADGKRQASITVAEGERQASILRAEGEKQSAILKAEGYAQALQAVYGAAQNVDAKTMTLQVIDGLKAIGASPSSTFVIPMEFTKLFGQIGSYLDVIGLPAGTNGLAERSSPR
ncbi:MAG: SPFH/Band 7/PHB domain protein [Chloroflexi bacterium]|nr:SPFH/Band 7/PHB domain protein [Chloroflexota bacterium]MBV9892686.1 SPFH/Band 7/PHB domain protein [Chloroflexota bacterium]